ncbi:hypothetical protein [Rhodococcus sp. 1168]|uniref:hypothetical protein n=1 Tax=Rhodococcus sp. 1168 TaxID=2018041 RepID=UPI00111C01DD|nr:hypothetical protein [Rhodococcus sp. 1168]
MAEQLVELLVDTFGLVPGGSKNSTDVAPVPLSAHLESTMDRRVAKLIGNEHFRIQYDRFRPRFSPLSIGMLLTQLIDGNGRSSYSEVAAVLGIRPARVRQSIAVLSQVINEDGASILYENGVEVLLEPALLFEQFRIVD